MDDCEGFVWPNENKNNKKQKLMKKRAKFRERVKTHTHRHIVQIYTHYDNKVERKQEPGRGSWVLANGSENKNQPNAREEK